MKNKAFSLLPLALGLLLVFSANVRAEQHRATHLGNPATRFAPTLHSPVELRSRFADPKLQPDIAAILRQWDWPGNLNDLLAAAASAEVREVQIPVGETMPFMSSREHGKPVCLRNVTWAGKEPVSAYAFDFSSNGRRYRCVTPKPCSNFFLEDLGAEPQSGLAIDCSVPEKTLVGRKIQVCLNVHNLGNIAEPAAAVTLPVPDGAEVAAITDGGVILNNAVTWRIADLARGSVKQVCAILKARRPGKLSFNSTASSASTQPVSGACETVVSGVSGILLEKIDDPDPVAVGETTTYTVRVTNQGSGFDYNVQVVAVFPPELVPVSSDEGVIAGQTVTLPIVPVLMPKHSVSFKIVAKGVVPGDGHTQFSLTSDMLKTPVNAEESTTVY